MNQDVINIFLFYSRVKYFSSKIKMQSFNSLDFHVNTLSISKFGGNLQEVNCS